MTADERRALELAARLDERNQERRRIQDAMLASALPKVDPGAPAIVVEDPAWHPGVMGIVASHLLERFYRPVYIVADGKGSVRSTPGISAVGGLHAARAHLRRWGGHAQAAGFALDMADFDAFRRAIHAFAAAHPTPEPAVVADALLGLDAVEDDLYAATLDLEPFGEGHPAPSFALRGPLASARAVGSEAAHLQLRLNGPSGFETKGVAFRHGALAAELSAGGSIDVAAALSRNEWNGRVSIEFEARAVRPGGPLALGDELADAPAGPGTLWRGPGDEPAAAPRIDPDAADPLAEVRAALAAGGAVRLALTAAELRALEAEADAWPTVSDVRRAWVERSRGIRPGSSPRAERVALVLDELGLVDAGGRAVRGVRVDPYASPRLRAGLVRRYTLRTLVEAYRRLDDAGFELAVRSLAEVGDPPAAADAAAGSRVANVAGDD